MEYISRHIENKVLELSKSYSAILLTGPRQAGKTTMLRSLSEREGMNGGCYIHVLVRFICETAQYFKAVSNSLIQEYTAPDESGVME